jgi:ergothioneine biosynthesis protein EgtB
MTGASVEPGPEQDAADIPRDRLADAYREVRRVSEALAAPLSAEDQQVQSMDDASPAKWHLAHVSWFYETFLLAPHLPGYEVFHPNYGYLFNSYYEAVGPRHARPRRGMLTRPPLEDVMRYRAHVDDAMIRFIETVDEDVLGDQAPLFALGLNHEQQHQELLLTDIKHALASQPLLPAYRDDLPLPSGNAAAFAFIEFMGGEHALGFDGAGFCFDNETPAHVVYTGEFKLGNRPVTNGEYADFIDAGGYRTATLWLADGWAWVERGGANMWGESAPMYWQKRDGAWWEFTLGGLRPLDRAAPASHITLYEADACARFMDARLPREDEWELAARMSGASDADANTQERGLLHPAAPLAAPRGGFVQMMGDVWEWTASAYAPYPGFRAAPGAVGEYNGKFMVSQLVLKGGSCATPEGHARPSYRNFFYPHQGWQFTGFRLAMD